MSPQVDLPEDPNLREITSAKPAFVNTPKDGNSPRSEPGARSLPSDGGENLLAFLMPMSVGATGPDTARRGVKSDHYAVRTGFLS